MYQIYTNLDDFKINLKKILKYISTDSKNRAYTFNNELFYVLNNIANMPYKYRKSIYHSDKNIRDCIFKGYTIPYLIDENNKKIILLDIFKWTNR